MNPKVFWEGTVVGPWSPVEAEEPSGLTRIAFAKPLVLHRPRFSLRVGLDRNPETNVLVVTITELLAFEALVVTSIVLDNFHAVLGRTWANVRLPAICGLVQEYRPIDDTRPTIVSPEHSLLIRGASRPLAAITRVDILRLVIQ